MGNLPSTFSDARGLLSVVPSALFDESFIQDSFKSSPLRAPSEVNEDPLPETPYSSEIFEQFGYMFRQSINFEAYSKALSSHSPQIDQLTELTKMRTELLARIGFQTRKNLEETVLFPFLRSFC